MASIVALASVVISAAWLPIVVKFFVAWRRRHNPVSLAICLVLLFIVFATMGHGVWAVFGHEDYEAVTSTVLAVQVLVCLFFYCSLYMSRKKFPEARKQHNHVE